MRRPSTAWARMLCRHVRRTDPTGDEMTNHISIDALSHDKIWPKPGMAKRPHETRQVGPMPHSGTARLDAASPKVVKVPSLVNEC